MAFLFKKKQEEETPSLEGLPPLPPLPGEESFPQPQRFAAPPQMPELPPLQIGRQQEPRLTVATERATVFVRVDKYKEIMQTVEGMQRKVDELQGTLNKIAAIKEKEAEIIHGWGAMLQETKSKIDEINSRLLKPTET